MSDFTELFAEQGGPSFTKSMDLYDWTGNQELRQALDEASPLLRGVVAAIKGHHMTLPILADGIARDGLGSDVKILSDDVEKRFLELFEQHNGSFFDKIGRNLRRNDGRVWVSTHEEHLRGTRSYGFPEVAEICLASMWRAATVLRPAGSNDDQELKDLVDNEIHRLTQGRPSGRALVTLKPGDPRILSVTFKPEVIPIIDESIVDRVKSPYFDPGSSYGIINLGIQGPIEPGAIESIEIIENDPHVNFVHQIKSSTATRYF